MSKSKFGFLLGADPELFLQKNGEKKILSAIGKIGGTKKAPKPAEGLAKGYAYQEDNVLVEYNIPPAADVREFTYANNTMMTYLNKMVGEKYDCHLVVKASHVMDDDQLQEPEAHVFGCDPDFNVWTMEDNPPPFNENPNLRSAGGHLHVGAKMTRMEKFLLGRLLDASVGLWSVIKDSDKRRRGLYGKAGAIREKPYGMEYRTLSNFWLKGDDYQRKVYDYVLQSWMRLGRKDFAFIDKHGDDIIAAINNSDKPLAAKLLEWQGL